MLIFDGKLRVYTTCRDCKHPMVVLDPTETSHPTCTPRPTKVESLAIGYLTALKAEQHEDAELTAQAMAELDAQPPRLLESAVLYAKWGWPVFPLGYRSKMPAIPKRKGGRGLLDATSDVERIRRWWTKHPNHNIGLATGHGFDVLDVDPEKGGTRSFVELLDHGRIPDCHGVTVTRNSGLHLYLPPTGEANYAGILPGIDHRGLGGYVVAPPSTLGPRERSWSWMAAPSPMLKHASALQKAG